MQVNPISLVTIKGASKRVRKPRVLTVEQFRLLVSHLREPFNTLALMCVCFGLRISEALALKWVDVDWLSGTLRVERGIVQQVVDDVKTDDSRKTLTISGDLLELLKVWKQKTQFSANEDWMFASPTQLGKLPWSYTGVKEELQRAADAAEIGHLRSHAFRHYAESGPCHVLLKANSFVILFSYSRTRCKAMSLYTRTNFQFCSAIVGRSFRLETYAA